MVIVHYEGRRAEVPLGGSRQTLDPRVVGRKAAREASVATCATAVSIIFHGRIPAWHSASSGKRCALRR